MHCDAGWRNFSFLKVTTDDDLVGWAEFNEGNGGSGLSTVIMALGQTLVGTDPRAIEWTLAKLHGITRQAAGGINQRAIGTIENALLDIKAKALGVPVYELFGGPIRREIPVYWSHCGGPRMRAADLIGVEPITSLDGLVKLGQIVREAGFNALKTNIFLFGGPKPVYYQPGFAPDGVPGWPELRADSHILSAITDVLAAFRQGAGDDAKIMLDANFNFRTLGFQKVARAVEPFDLFWLEAETIDAASLAEVRRSSRVTIASCETLYGRRSFRPYFEQKAMDVAIIDVPWNGFGESVKIASAADTYEVNCAPHNFHGNLCSMMSAHFCAVVPNFEIMELDVDRVPWNDEIVTVRPDVRNGVLHLPTGPGWGTEVREEVVRAHPPRKR